MEIHLFVGSLMVGSLLSGVVIGWLSAKGWAGG